MMTATERRIRHLERLVRNLRRKQETIFQRYYARNVRREDMQKRVTRNYAEAAKRYERHATVLRRLAHLATRMFGSRKKEPKIVFFVNANEHQKLRRILRTRTNAARR